jgi:hypothetical protein
MAPHWRHRVFFPACSSPARIALPQAHVNEIAIDPRSIHPASHAVPDIRA